MIGESPGTANDAPAGMGGAGTAGAGRWKAARAVVAARYPAEMTWPSTMPTTPSPAVVPVAVTNLRRVTVPFGATRVGIVPCSIRMSTVSSTAATTMATRDGTASQREADDRVSAASTPRAPPATITMRPHGGRLSSTIPASTGADEDDQREADDQHRLVVGAEDGDHGLFEPCRGPGR